MSPIVAMKLLDRERLSDEGGSAVRGGLSSWRRRPAGPRAPGRGAGRHGGELLGDSHARDHGHLVVGDQKVEHLRAIASALEPSGASITDHPRRRSTAATRARRRARHPRPARRDDSPSGISPRIGLTPGARRSPERWIAAAPGNSWTFPLEPLWEAPRLLPFIRTGGFIRSAGNRSDRPRSRLQRTYLEVLEPP